MSPSTISRSFTDGVYCPLITPFKPDTEEVDYDALRAQVVRLASARMGIVVLGTNGEASHLSDTERAAVIRATREALDSNGFTQVPILAGTGTGSAKETIRLTIEARDAGADYVIVIAPGYFSFALGRDLPTLRKFFIQVLDASPLPVMIYNFPGAASGIDFDSDFLIELSEHQNCFGAKLTCASVGKGQRLSVHTQSAAYKARHPRPFFVLPGYSDILLPALISRASGCITGTGNVIPKTIVKLYDTAVSALATGNGEQLEAARELQDLVAEADWAIVKAGIGGTKYAMDTYVQEGLGGVPRTPLPHASAGIKTMLASGLKRALAYENSL
ncbi:putative dihydrodipicolinate synthase [Mycena sanguinolenta]|uniref:Putative dihydrodipicolinate synthase n=1 Tax=Mycena sanguinolenta TaxID=230812 RepID=A0A8H7DIA7_9AGAR|nr:putative dihydrodipicolinate synthase [Mycena sanguinolenta]